MPVLEIALLAAALLCGLVAGFLFAFAAVVMPGIADLDDRAFLRAFQVVDGVIQRGQPLFGLVWLGSALAVVGALVLGVSEFAGAERLLLLGAGASYLLGVQLMTLRVHLPLNGALQRLELETATDADCRAERERFERRWNRANVARALVATAATAAWLVLLLRR